AAPGVVVPRRALATVGVDGARFRDSLAIVATDVEGGYQWPACIIERPETAGDDYEHDLDVADEAMLDLFDRLKVWRVYVDPQYIEPLFERWRGRWGDRRVVPWWTYRARPMAHALRSYR